MKKKLKKRKKRFYSSASFGEAARATQTTEYHANRSSCAFAIIKAVQFVKRHGGRRWDNYPVSE